MIEAIILIIALLANIILGLLVYLKNPRGTTNRRFLFLASSICLWSTANYLSIHSTGSSQLFLVRLVIAFAALLNYAVYLTFKAFPDSKAEPDKTIIPATIGTIAVMALAFTPAVFSHLVSGPRGATAVPAPGISLFLAQTLILLGGAAATLANRYRKSRNLEREQFKYVIVGLAATFGLIIITNFVLVAFFSIRLLLPFGAAYTLFFTGSVAYSVITQRLFDVRMVLARAITYLLLLITFVGSYAIGAFGVLGVLFPHSSNSLAQILLNTALAVVLALTFQPLRHFLERVTDGIFYRSRYDSQVVLNDFSKVLVSEYEMTNILDKTLAVVCRELHIQYGQLVIYEDDRIYKIAHNGRLPNRLIVAPELAHLRRRMFVSDEEGEGDIKTLMARHDIRLSMPLQTRNEFIGYLLLGDKLSGDIYSSQDIRILEIMGKELAVAIQNAKAYTEIAEFNVTLQERVQHATSRLRVANQRLKDLDRAKDEFLSMASHQLRTPLTTIKGYLSMILEGDAGELNPTQKEFTEYAFESSRRMVGLISDLLNVSRLSAGKFMIETKPTDVVDMVKDEVRQLQSHAANKSLELVFNQPKSAFPNVEIDENKTRQVIMNFIDNAIYYTPKGRIEVNLSHERSLIRLTVKDSGIGVPKEAQSKLFSKFFRAGNAQSVRPDGTGLGLYLAKRVIEDQGGTIIFESSEGQGSTFGFELPLRVKSTRENSNSKVTHAQ